MAASLIIQSSNQLRAKHQVDAIRGLMQSENLPIINQPSVLAGRLITCVAMWSMTRRHSVKVVDKVCDKVLYKACNKCCIIDKTTLQNHSKNDSSFG